MTEYTPTGANNPFEWDVDDGEVESPEHIEDGDAYIEALSDGYDHHTILSESEIGGASTVYADDAGDVADGDPVSVPDPLGEGSITVHPRQMALYGGLALFAGVVLVAAAGGD